MSYLFEPDDFNLIPEDYRPWVSFQANKIFSDLMLTKYKTVYSDDDGKVWCEERIPQDTQTAKIIGINKLEKLKLLK